MIVLACVVTINCVDAQSNKDAVREHRAVERYTEKELNDRSTKYARKEAKRLKKAGWIVAPGHLPLEKQLDRAFKMEYELDENGYAKYLRANAISIGETYDAAHAQAIELAKTNLAGLISSEITQMVENTVANSQLAAGEAASIVETVAASKNIISQRIGRVITLVECYREDSKTRMKEVNVTIAYNADMAREAAKQTIREELEKKGQDLHEQLDRVLGF